MSSHGSSKAENGRDCRPSGHTWRSLFRVFRKVRTFVICPMNHKNMSPATVETPKTYIRLFGWIKHEQHLIHEVQPCFHLCGCVTAPVLMHVGNQILHTSKDEANFTALAGFQTTSAHLLDICQNCMYWKQDFPYGCSFYSDPCHIQTLFIANTSYDCELYSKTNQKRLLSLPKHLTFLSVPRCVDCWLSTTVSDCYALGIFAAIRECRWITGLFFRLRWKHEVHDSS